MPNPPAEGPESPKSLLPTRQQRSNTLYAIADFRPDLLPTCFHDFAASSIFGLSLNLETIVFVLVPVAEISAMAITARFAFAVLLHISLTGRLAHAAASPSGGGWAEARHCRWALHQVGWHCKDYYSEKYARCHPRMAFHKKCSTVVRAPSLPSRPESYIVWEQERSALVAFDKDATVPSKGSSDYYIAIKLPSEPNDAPPLPASKVKGSENKPRTVSAAPKPKLAKVPKTTATSTAPTNTARPKTATGDPKPKVPKKTADPTTAAATPASEMTTVSQPSEDNPAATPAADAGPAARAY